MVEIWLKDSSKKHDREILKYRAMHKLHRKLKSASDTTRKLLVTDDETNLYRDLDWLSIDA